LSVKNFYNKYFKISQSQYNLTKSFKILKTVFFTKIVFFFRDYQNSLLKSQSNTPPKWLKLGDNLQCFLVLRILIIYFGNVDGTSSFFLHWTRGRSCEREPEIYWKMFEFYTMKILIWLHGMLMKFYWNIRCHCKIDLHRLN